MSGGTELVIFYGPPFIGKTLHYVQNYSKTHCRISASEVFKEDKCSNLRLVVLKVIELLRQGKNVVIDDENWYIATRQSYTSLIKQKVPKCVFSIVQFITDASAGYQQCLWAREWALVEQTLLEKKDYTSTMLLQSDDKLDCWFARKRNDLNPPESPTTSEGFSIVSVKPQLTCPTFYKLNLPALFVQWQSVLTDAKAENLACKSNVPAVLNKWSEKNPYGRIIIIGPKMKNEKEIVEERNKTLLMRLASQLISPVYFTFIDEKHQMDHYSCLPQPGVLAFLQKLHTVNLHHKGTLYVYSSDEHYRAASSVGIRTIKASKLFSHPHLVDSVFCGEKASPLSFLQGMLQVNCSGSEDAQAGESAPEAQIPFFSRARESSSPLAWQYCYGKVNGVCFKDRMALERYQTQYKMAAKPARGPGRTKPKSSRTEYVPSTVPAQSSSKIQSEDTRSFNARALVENVDLRSVAKTDGRYYGGFQCRDNVFDVNVNVLERRVKITGKCHGSSKDPYDVEVVLSDSSGLLEAHCSCPDLASKTGRCKHVIGLMLQYKDHQTPAEQTSHVDSNQAGSSKTSGSSDTNKSGRKRDVETLYCLSPEELMESAKDVLQKHEERMKREGTSTQKADNGSGNEVVSEDQQEGRITEDEGKSGDIFEELLFSAIKNSEEPSKKRCPERRSSLVEDTPSDKLPCSDQASNSVYTAIIPDSFVAETVSSVPETIRSISTSSTHSSCEETDPFPKRLESEKESFEAFLDEMI